MEADKFIFKLSNGGLIKLTKEVLVAVEAYKQVNKGDTEAGGVLLGRFIKDSKDIIIDHVTVPTDGDERKRYSFKRLSPMHQIIVDEMWFSSKSTFAAYTPGH